MNTQNYKEKFQGILDAIMSVHSSDAKTKGGLLASFLAVTEPLTTNTGISCSQDTDCTNNPSICPDPANCALQCVDGVCGGYNHGFYRPDAYLDIVYISKSDDQSPGPLNDYIDMLNTIKGYQNKDFIHAHAVTWQAYCQGHAGVMEGKRYVETSLEFNGKQATICDDWAWLLNEIGEGGGGPLKKQFFLAGTPDSATITVTVNGTKCTSGWNYDVASNSIIFSPTSPCMPKYNDKIDVSYSILCK
ncbi:MAG: hypothetical protein FJ088_13035 [Deltaproteobacteria bacterium]|nr:hypothetical protein [Deltaproteobacteria bacterium]